jgi:5-methyltetrahydrofolate--homocysteine methyltransferase
VHDIGKNIVGVVLQCNNFDVVDLGVMVACDTILETARKENADMVGSPASSLRRSRKWRTSRREMERLGFKMPLLIGGATTSRTPYRVKIEPNYSGPTVWVPDASRAVGVASQLSSDELRPKYMEGVRADYVKVREQHARKTGQKSVSLEAARANAIRIDWASYAPPCRRQLGITALRNYPLEKLVPFIDWAPFFQAWDLAGKYPDILQDAVVGEAGAQRAEGRPGDARSRREGPLAHRERGCTGLWPANSVGRRHRDLRRREARPRADDLAQPAPAGREAVGQSEPVPRGLRGARRIPACATMSAPSRSRAASASTRA